MMAADIPSAEPMRSAYLTPSMDKDSEAERIYAALSDGGRPLMPMQETFFASRFGQVRDRFGINWMILHERPMPPPNNNLGLLGRAESELCPSYFPVLLVSLRSTCLIT